MSFTPSTVPIYAVAPLEIGPVVLPTTAKTVLTDLSNSVTVLPAVTASRKVILPKLVIRAVGALTTGRMMLFTFTGTTAIFLRGIQHNSVAADGEIDFLFTDADYQIVPEGVGLIVGSSVAQANAAVVVGRAKLM